MQLWKLGCRWESGNPLFYDFILERNIVVGWITMDYQIGDWLLITDGFTVLSFAEVTSHRKSVLNYPEFQGYFQNLKIPFEQNLFIYDACYIQLRKEDRFSYPLQRGIVKVHGHEYVHRFSQIKEKYLNEIKMTEVKRLVEFKKQIILQGPPGTGKTRKAKEIAEQLIVPQKITEEDIRSFLIVGDKIKSGKDYTKYLTKGFGDEKLMLENESGNVFNISFSDIIKAFENRTWETETLTNGNQSASAGIAKFIFKKYLTRSKQFKLIQFHPSYTHEDFMRGIVVESKITHADYVTKNKVLAQIASDAHDNYLNSQKESQTLSKENWVNKQFELFIEDVEAEILKKGEFQLNDKVSVFNVEDDAFRYYGANWEYKQRMKFKDLKIEYLAKVNSRRDIKSLPNVSGRSKQHATYDYMMVEKFRLFLKNRPAFNSGTNDKEELKNYVLVIDEINRANLPSVLGELIYALEYRGESVGSMYEIDGDSSIILPPNLYIIGTMNTADRSVGHIDYAIRRRFAFVEILPSAEVINNVVPEEIKAKAIDLFNKVANLFIDGNIAPDFKASDVQLGHSYFLAKSEDELKLKLDYEIKPLLKEYLTDGILQANISIDGTNWETEKYIDQLNL